VVADPLDVILGLLGASKPGTYRCPAHDDGTASLSVGRGKEDVVVLKCQAGCSTEAVVSALGLRMADLFPQRPEGDRRRDPNRPRIVDTYDYVDEDGVLLYQVVRFDPKGFRQRRPDGRGGWIWNIKGVRPVLYRLPLIIDALDDDSGAIIVTEGEKDCQAAERAGYLATTSAMGAGKWRQEYTDVLAKAKGGVFVVTDDDEPGRRHAATVAAAIRQAGGRVSVFDPAPGCKDLAEHLGQGRDLDELVVWPEENIASRAHGPLLENYWGGDDYLDRGDDVVAPWAVPGLLRVNWRVILVGGEGAGKSTALRQFAICAAHGIHPMNFGSIPVVRTVVIDLENPDEAIMETGRIIRNQALLTQTQPGFTPTPRNTWHLWTEPRGLDLRKQADQVRFTERIELHRPHMVCIGPAYKMHPAGQDNDTEAVRAVMDFLDRSRMVYGFGLVIEHHAAKGQGNNRPRDLNPFGSSLWLRWGELGFKLVPTRDLQGQPATADTTEPGVLELRPFRGSRVRHAWPREFHRDPMSPWPWLGRWSEGQEMLRAREPEPPEERF
jgi:hypothetical protein